MNFQPNTFYHVYNRGNNSQTIFFNQENYIYFLKKVRNEITPFVDMVAYCLMPNHYHLLISTKEEKEMAKALPRKFGSLQSSYTRAVNNFFNRKGSLFQQKAKAKILDESEEQLFNCFHYVHQNPYRAGIVKKMEDWEFSSFRDYIGLRNGSLINYEIAYDYIDLPRDKQKLIDLSYKIISDNNARGLFL